MGPAQGDHSARVPVDTEREPKWSLRREPLLSPPERRQTPILSEPSSVPVIMLTAARYHRTARPADVDTSVGFADPSTSSATELPLNSTDM